MATHHYKRRIVKLLGAFSFLFCIFYFSVSLSTDAISPNSDAVIRVFNQDYTLSEAKQLGSEQAEFAYQVAKYFQIANQKDNAEVWFKQATRLGNSLASIYLAKRAFDQKDEKKAVSLLLPHTDNPEALTLLVEVSLSMGDLDFVKAEHNKLAEMATQSPTVNTFLDTLYGYHVIKARDNKELGIEDTFEDCPAPIQMFATNLADLRYSDTLIESFNSNPLKAYFCFAKPQYIPLNKLRCTLTKNTAIQCDESIWQFLTISPEIRYISVVLPQGGANVNSGIMYLDNNDDANVLSHELTHLRGFIDEYALPSDHKRCLQPQSAPFSYNIAVLKPFVTKTIGNRKQAREKVLSQLSWGHLIKDDTPILTEHENGWQLGTTSNIKGHELGLYPAMTCNNGDATSYKPFKTKSHLHYYEYPLSASYLDLIAQNKFNHAMPSYHYNVAKALALKGKDAEMYEWLKRAIDMEEINSPRILKIQQGEF